MDEHGEIKRIDIDKVVIHRAGLLKNQWRAISYGANGEKIAWTETYRDKRDAEKAGWTISEGAPVTVEDE